MGLTRRDFLATLASSARVAGVAGAAALTGCAASKQADPVDPSTSEPVDPEVDLKEFESLALDQGAWRYDEDHDVYYQLGLVYCKEPATKTYESLAVFVPGAYFTAEENGNTYTCTVNEHAVVGNFTPSTAPILMPVNTGTLSAQTSPTAYSYQGLSPYLDAGCIYVYAGFRGRSAGYDTTDGSSGKLFPGGSPWPVVDLKAAVRYLRYNAATLPCDASRVFVFGFGAGGGVSAVMGASGDSELYTPYLDSIGAVTHDAEGAAVSDAVEGSASWCPITSFDVADAAYEWAAGQYASTATRAEGTWTRELSQDLAAAYGEWVNGMDLRGDDDAQLTLDETETGAYALGSYATALLANANDAASWFLANTAFPYTYTPQRIDEPTFPGDPNLLATRESEAAASQTQVSPTVETTDDGLGAAEGSGDEAATGSETGEEPVVDDTAAAPSLTGVSQVESTIYDSAQNYFAALNADYWWINYSSRSQTVTVSSLRDLALHLRSAEKSVSPYDLPDRSSRVNQLFGIGEESTLHFDAVVADLVAKNGGKYAGALSDEAASGWSDEYETDWADDLEKLDSLDVGMEQRVAMMNPLFWLSGYYEGYGQSEVCPHWRVNEGMFDTDVSPCCAANLVLALKKYDGVADVAYTPVWGQGHVLAERSGSATANLISWVVSCCS